MADLILRPAREQAAAAGKPWALQLRYAGMPRTEYFTIAHVSDEVAREIIEAGAAFWLFGDPDKKKARA